jgi:ribose transport system permease protein
MNILANTAVLGIVSIGQAFVIIQGGFDLSVAGTVPLGAVSFALLVNSGWGVIPAIFLSILFGTTVGLFNALITTKVGINPLVTTLGTLSITKALAFLISDGVAILLRNTNSAVLAQTSIGGVPYYVWAFLLIGLLSSLILRYTVFGRMIYAVGGNRESSRLAGINVDLISIYTYMICGGLAAFSGVVVANQLLLGSATIGNEAALTSIAAVILGGASLQGGMGGIFGTVMGVFVIGTLANGMALMHVQVFYQQMATGIMLLLAVGFGRLRSLISNGD